MMPKEYRPLLPVPDACSATDSTPSVEGTPDAPVTRKHAGVVLACNLCRSKKVRCDGARPTCSTCKKRGIEKCFYNEKRDASKDALDLLKLLKSSPESTAIAFLRLLRTSGDPAAVLSFARGEPPGEQYPSASDPIQDGLMPKNLPLELELMTKHPILYPSMRPIHHSSLEHSDLFRSINVASVESLGQLTTSRSSSTYDADNIQKLVRNNSDSNAGTRRFEGQYQSEPHSRVPGLCDKRLNDLKIAFWTNVQIPSELAAKVLSLYLETDHPLLGIFEPDQFIEDLVNHCQTSCSSLLVNTLLYWGCQMYSQIDKSANEYTQQLSKESQRLWAIEKSSDSILNMISAQMLSLAFMGNGKDHEVLLFQIDSVKMGTRMGLLGVDGKTAASKLAEVPEEMMHAYAFAAWGVFNWATLVTMFYRQPGLLYLTYPPTLAIPGDTASDSAAGSSFTLLGNATIRYALPSYMGHTFPAICAFWRIMREVSLVYFSNETDPRSHVSIDFAELKYRELLAWAKNLPTPVIRNFDSPHHVVIFHMWIHSAILDIFRPFIQQEQDVQSKSLRLRTFSAVDNSPVAAYKASVNQLKQLVLHYQSNYTSSSYTILWQTALTYVATAVRQDKEDPTWKSWFLLCIHGYKALRRPFPVVEVIGRGLLTMTMRDTDITSEDARQLMCELKERGLGGVKGGIRATFMGDLDMAGSNPEGARMESLAGDFEDVAIFKDFINDHEDLEMSEL